MKLASHDPKSRIHPLDFKCMIASMPVYIYGTRGGGGGGGTHPTFW